MNSTVNYRQPSSGQASQLTMLLLQLSAPVPTLAGPAPAGPRVIRYYVSYNMTPNYKHGFHLVFNCGNWRRKWLYWVKR